MDAKIQENEKIEISITEKEEFTQEPEEIIPLLNESDGRKMVILIESTLSSDTLKKLNQHCSTYHVQSDDNEQFINFLPEVDIYIVHIKTCIDWYMMNRYLLEDFTIVYYAKIGLIKEIDIDSLRVHYVRNRLLRNFANSKKDLFDKLS